MSSSIFIFACKGKNKKAKEREKRRKLSWEQLFLKEIKSSRKYKGRLEGKKFKEEELERRKS
jgi:ribosomal protein RSM22 (predicted rRNA methylase)